MILNNKEIGRRIQIARNNMHLTQEALAEKLEISLTHMCALENGYSGASLPTIADISLKLDVSLDWLVFGSTQFHETDISRIFSDCTFQEYQILLNVLKSLKTELKKYTLE